MSDCTPLPPGTIPNKQEPTFTPKERLLMDQIRRKLTEIHNLCSKPVKTHKGRKQYVELRRNLAALCQRGGYDMKALLGEK